MHWAVREVGVSQTHLGEMQAHLLPIEDALVERLFGLSGSQRIAEGNADVPEALEELERDPTIEGAEQLLELCLGVEKTSHHTQPQTSALHSCGCCHHPIHHFT